MILFNKLVYFYFLGEEAKNPKRNIPLSILFSLIIIFLSYFGVSTVLTMMWPYYLQDPDAPFPVRMIFIHLKILDSHFNIS